MQLSGGMIRAVCLPIVCFLGEVNSALWIQENGKEIEHGGHAVHPLNNIFNRLDLNRVENPDRYA